MCNGGRETQREIVGECYGARVQPFQVGYRFVVPNLFVWRPPLAVCEIRQFKLRLPLFFYFFHKTTYKYITL